METSIQNDKNRIDRLKIEIDEIELKKLEKSKFEERQTKYEEMALTTKNCIEDVSNTLKSTDNYIEKYLPFKVINIVSEIMRPVFAFSGIQEQWFYEEEDKIYKLYCKLALIDSGNANYDKKGYFVPEIPKHIHG